MSIFERYAPFVQEYIYRNNWESLRSIQVAAGDTIFNTDENVLICASTASGKTEAAFFPIISLFYEDMPKSVGCIYIGPLKALINDQFDRLTELCDEAEIPVWHWHGDVSMSHKNKLLRHPSGILQITPESLEAMLMRKYQMLPLLFGDLRFIVIDEVHSLLRGDRGGQTLCLIERLCKAAGVNPRRIGLSATMGDPVRAGEFLAAGTGRGTVIPKIEEKKARWRLSVEHFYIQNDEGKASKTAADASTAHEPELQAFPAIADASTAHEPELQAFPAITDAAAEYDGDSQSDDSVAEEKLYDPSFKYIFDNTRNKKCLVFTNSREECEAVTTTLRRYSEVQGESERFQIHHGNISSALRETAEELMKDDDELQTTVTTATLELGIDIGRLEKAFQVDAPWTVSSFLQRMGRTGRRGQPPEMHFVIREEEVEERALLPVTIPWKLIQAISLIQLYAEEKWVEPPRLERLPFSLLYHQTMSTLVAGGEMLPAELAGRVLGLQYFHRITQEDYRELLLHLIDIGHIERTAEGGLIVGLAGERIVNGFKFYGVFQENEEYSVRSEAGQLGTIVAPPPVGEKIAIAGHVWTVLEVDRTRHSVYCTKVRGSVPAYFGQCPGDLNTKILLRMRQVLTEDINYPYLKKNASDRLEKARNLFRDKNITDNMLFNLGGTKWCFMPWLGTYSFMALERFLRIKLKGRLGLSNFDSSKPFFMVFNMKADKESFFSILSEELAKPFDMMELIYPKEVPLFEKYDEFVPEHLVKKSFAYGVLDISEVKERFIQSHL